MRFLLSFFYENSGSFLSFFGLVGIIGSMIFYSHNRLHKDFVELKKDAKADRARIDALGQRIDAMGQRIDAMGQRIDGIYTFLMAYVMGTTPDSIKEKQE